MLKERTLIKRAIPFVESRWLLPFKSINEIKEELSKYEGRLGEHDDYLDTINERREDLAERRDSVNSDIRILEAVLSDLGEGQILGILAIKNAFSNIGYKKPSHIKTTKDLRDMLEYKKRRILELEDIKGRLDEIEVKVNQDIEEDKEYIEDLNFLIRQVKIERFKHLNKGLPIKDIF